MTDRERFLETCSFGRPDRIPYYPGLWRQSTLDRWHREGLPPEADLNKLLGLDHWEEMALNLGPIPPFEETVLEDLGDYKIWIDSLGAKRLDFKVDATPGFVTRTWLEFPVKTREDFEKMKERYNPHSPGRYPENWEEEKSRWKNRDFVLGFSIPWLFWRVRDWVGLHRLCTMFLDEPEFVEEMMQFVEDFTLAAVEKAVREVEVDYVFLNEDMAYKTASMISPKMFREFLAPHYRRLVKFLREHGVPVIIADCDGHISELIPLWIELGVNATWPVEIAAHNDPVEYRRRFGKEIVLMGGIDKRQLSKGKREIEREVMSKVPWLIEQGGYIPSIDHGIPPDVPLENYLYYVELIKKIATGG